MSKNHYKSTCLRKNALKRCKKTDNVVLIDVDSDNCDEVIIIDGLESLQQKSRGPSVPRCDQETPFSNIIEIDDDTGIDNEHPEVGIQGWDNVKNVFYSNNRTDSASGQSCSSVGSDGEDCQFIHSTAPCRNRYGLSTESETDSFESDCSDCEYMEGSSGKLREQWEKASTKKNYNVKSRVEDQASASGSPGDADPFVEVKNCSKVHPEPKFPVFSSSRDATYEKNCPFVAAGDGDLGEESLNPDPGSSSVQFNWKVPQEKYSSFKGHSTDWCPGETSSTFPSFSDEKDPGFMSCSYHIHDDNCCNNGFNSLEEPYTRLGEPCQLYSNPGLSERSRTDGNEKGAQFNSHQPKKRQSHHDTVISKNKDETSDTNSLDEFLCENNSSGVEEEEVYITSPSVGKTKPVTEGGVCNSIPSSSKSEIHNENAFLRANKSDLEESSMCSTGQLNETHMARCSVKTKEAELECAQDGAATAAVEIDIINYREKLKETQEYKQAIEEEWASRQRELQIQAEEVQKLRKRKKAESMRLLDMEKRQKQRLEEVRATQKQDEENIKLKEQLRGEIRKELTKLEMTCRNMASVLRGLGIHVGGALYPSTHEVHVAYKQALLKFHPDRASRNNIRQQVEAEEKFKLMSRMKEKLKWNS